MVDFFGLFSIDILYIVLGLSGVSLITFVIAIITLVKAVKLKKKYNTFMKGEDGKSVEKLVKGSLDSIEQIRFASEENSRAVKDIYEKMQYVFQKVGIVKYDAFHEMGGKLSFALTMLDNKNNGFIINSMHSREGCYTYIKEVVAGESYIELGDEEAESLKKALAGPLGDTDLGHMNDVINNTYDVKELDDALNMLDLSEAELAEAEAAASKEQA